MTDDARDEVQVRGRSYARHPVEASPRLPRPVVWRTFEASEVSFGVRGRLVVTGVLLVPAVAFLLTGSPWWLLLSLGSLPVVLWALRDTWRRR